MMQILSYCAITFGMLNIIAFCSQRKRSLYDSSLFCGTTNHNFNRKNNNFVCSAWIILEGVYSLLSCFGFGFCFFIILRLPVWTRNPCASPKGSTLDSFLFEMEGCCFWTP